MERPWNNRNGNGTKMEQLVNEDGILRMQVINGGFSMTPSDETRRFFPNGATLIFDLDEFEILWQAASFESKPDFRTDAPRPLPQWQRHKCVHWVASCNY